MVDEQEAERFRKQKKQLEKVSAKKERVRMKKTEEALLKQAEIMTHGLRAYLTKLDKQNQNYAKSKQKETDRPESKDSDDN